MRGLSDGRAVLVDERRLVLSVRLGGGDGHGVLPWYELVGGYGGGGAKSGLADYLEAVVQGEGAVAETL